MKGPLKLKIVGEQRNILQDIGKTMGELGSQDHTDNSTVEIGKKAEKSPGELWRFTVTQTIVKDHHLMLVGKKNSFERK